MEQFAALVLDDGSIAPYDSSSVNNEGDVRTSLGVRPAFKLSLSDVIFTSDAVGGKSAAIGLNPAQSAGTSLKLTLLDSNPAHLNITVPDVSARQAVPGGTVSINYTGAITGADKVVSCVIVDSAGNVLYYGKLSDAASGTASFTVPSGMAAGSYTVRLFNEQVNGDYETDFTSQPVTIPLTVTVPPQAPIVTPTEEPTDGPTEEPTGDPADEPTGEPTDESGAGTSSEEPTETSTETPTQRPGIIVRPGVPNVPPPAANLGATLVPNDNGGGFVEFDEDGVPLGEWHFDEEIESWIFDPIVPMAVFPVPATGDVGAVIPVALFALLALCAAVVATRKKRVK
jgi:hypothetical protein